MREDNQNEVVKASKVEITAVIAPMLLHHASSFCECSYKNEN
jgi:hypothetical protein